MAKAALLRGEPGKVRGGAGHQGRVLAHVDDGGVKGAYDCIKAFSESDTTEDLKQIDISTLVLHGDDDQIVPIQSAALKSIRLLQDGTLKVYPGDPTGSPVRTPVEFNEDLVNFIKT